MTIPATFHPAQTENIPIKRMNANQFRDWQDGLWEEAYADANRTLGLNPDLSSDERDRRACAAADATLLASPLVPAAVGQVEVLEPQDLKD